MIDSTSSFHYILSFILTAFSTALLGSFVYLKKRSEPFARVFLLYCLSIGWWSFCDLHLFLGEERTSILLWVRLGTIGVFWIPTLFLHFILSFTHQTARYAMLLLFGQLISCAISMTAFSRLVVEDVTHKFPSSAFDIVPGPLYVPAMLFFFSIVLMTTAILFKAYQASSPPEKLPLRYLLISTVISYCGGTLNFLPVFNMEIPYLNAFATYTIPLYVLLTTYAIIKHNLMDIRVVIQRTLVYSLLTACLTGGYFLFVLIMEQFFKNFVGYQSFVVTLIAALVLAISFTPLKELIQNILDRVFFKGSLAELAEERAALQQQLVRTDQLRAVGTFAASMAHEIKNPLTTIKTFLEHLPDKGDDPAFREHCRRLVGQEVSKIDHLVRNVLEFAKPSPPHKRPTDLTLLCDEVLALLQPQCLKQGVNVIKVGLWEDSRSPFATAQDRSNSKGRASSSSEAPEGRGVEKPSTDPTCEVDPTQIKQALLNLLLNSLEAMPDGGTLTVGLTQDNGHLTISIQDTGPGIPKEIQGRLAEPFFTTKPHGTGLGLSIVRSIVEGHRGKLTLMSSKSGAQAVIQVHVASVQRKGE